MHKIIKKRISATKADTEKEKENTEKLQSYYLKRNKNNETILKISVMLRTNIKQLLFLMLIFSFYLLLNVRRLINHQIVCLIVLYILSLLFSNLLRFYGSKETQTKI